ncbi:MAG: hypothetical protein LBJ31_01360 [Treponema sp.]|jgi:hypothetical protein|nr:hypothetical protein [Treponema sp.]
MKKLVIIILTTICSFKLSAQSLEGLNFSTGGDGSSPSMWFKDNTVSIVLPLERGIYIDKARYSFSIINGIYRISVLSYPKIELYLLFEDEFGYFSIIAPYKFDSGILLNVTNERLSRLPRGGGDDFIVDSPSSVIINTSSFLDENGKEYVGRNLTRLFTRAPWVEGKEDAGTGEYIELDFSQAYVKTIDTIVISNGFSVHLFCVFTSPVMPHLGFLP